MGKENVKILKPEMTKEGYARNWPQCNAEDEGKKVLIVDERELLEWGMTADEVAELFGQSDGTKEGLMRLVDEERRKKIT